MIYDATELKKRKITEAHIEALRKLISEGIANATTPFLSTVVSSNMLPFVIDIIAEHEFECNPSGHSVFLTIKIKR